MNQWIKKLNQIWNSTQDIDANLEDIIKVSIKRNALTQMRLQNQYLNPWSYKFHKPDLDHETNIETRKPANVAMVKKYEDGEIRYDFNNYGFRCEDIKEKTNDDLVIVSLGCSFTFGAGVSVEDRWSDVLCKKIQETTSLKVKNYNLALEGHTNDYCARTLYKTISNLKPDIYFILFTFRNRLEWIDDHGKLDQVIPGYDTRFIEVANDGIAMYNFNKNLVLIRALCESHRVPFLFSTVDPLIDKQCAELNNYIGKFNHSTLSIDNEHPGPKCHYKLAEQFFKKYKTLI